MEVFLFYRTDNWNSRESKDLVYIGTNREASIKKLMKLESEPITEEQAEDIRRMNQSLAVHERRRGREKEISKVSIMDFDKPFFKGKQVLIFDDIITTGGSYAIFAEEVEKHGAHVVGGLFLARTHYIYKKV